MITRLNESQLASAPDRTLFPPLETGDHLTREEFERRYEARPDIKKAELIEAVVYVPSPTRLKKHGSPQAALIGWLCHYWALNPTYPT